MPDMFVSVQPALQRLRRRLVVGVFLDVWPAWAAGTLLAGGAIALACRIFFAPAASWLPWLWAAPIVALVPVAIICMLRRYQEHEIAALADSLSGGHGLLLTQLEQQDPRWAGSPMLDAAGTFALPRLRPWRKLAPLVPAAAFLAGALWVPQRISAADGDGALAQEIAADLAATVEALKQQSLVTPEEEKRLEEEIERIRRAARQRVDSSSWEAADALKEKVAANMADKRDALTWARESAARYGAAAAGASAEARASHASELAQALDKLAQSGLLASAPADLKGLLKGGKLPTDPAAMRQLAAALGKYLAETGGKMGDLAALGKGTRGGPGKFDPGDFPLDGDGSGDGNGRPGRGGVNRGRADAEMTWGKESVLPDRFKTRALPPGAPRSPDDWAPVVEMPGSPQASATISTLSAARAYGPAAGQGAWRRTLAPRHRTAVRKYFDK